MRRVPSKVRRIALEDRLGMTRHEEGLGTASLQVTPKRFQSVGIQPSALRADGRCQISRGGGTGNQKHFYPDECHSQNAADNGLSARRSYMDHCRHARTWPPSDCLTFAPTLTRAHAPSPHERFRI